MTKTAFCPPQAAGKLSRTFTRMRALALATHPVAIVVSACLRENSPAGHLHLPNSQYCILNTVRGFRGKSFPRVKAVTYLGRGALRLSRVHAEVTLARRGSQLSNRVRAEPSEVNVMGGHVRAPSIPSGSVNEPPLCAPGAMASRGPRSRRRPPSSARAPAAPCDRRRERS
jgi:hypothetical protein